MPFTSRLRDKASRGFEPRGLVLGTVKAETGGLETWSSEALVEVMGCEGKPARSSFLILLSLCFHFRFPPKCLAHSLFFSVSFDMHLEAKAQSLDGVCAEGVDQGWTRTV